MTKQKSKTKKYKKQKIIFYKKSHIKHKFRKKILIQKKRKNQHNNNLIKK